LLPALVPVLIVVVVSWPDQWPYVVATALYGMDFAMMLRQTQNPLGHAWSLSIEEQFYILWPLIISGLAAVRRLKPQVVLLAVWGAVTVARMTMAGAGEGASWYNSPIFHGTGLLLGSAAAFGVGRPKLGWAGIAGLVLVIAFIDTYPQNLPTSVAILAAELLTLLVILDPPRLLAWTPLRRLGRISYGVYLWHIPVIWALNAKIPDLPTWLLAILAVTMATALAGVSWTLIEQPILGRRNLDHRLANREDVAGIELATEESQ
jgi:peptidoglycan/LPS O-acetylase OafA/YrhL